MLFYKIKCFFNKNKEVSADFSLNKQIKSMMNATFSPLDKSVAPAVMNEIKNSRKYKNNFVYKFNYRIVPIALSILFIFLLVFPGFGYAWGGAAYYTALAVGGTLAAGATAASGGSAGAITAGIFTIAGAEGGLTFGGGNYYPEHK